MPRLPIHARLAPIGATIAVTAAAVLATAVAGPAAAQCEMTKLQASDRTQHAGFGFPCLDGRTLLVGATNRTSDEDPLTDAAYVFRFDGSAWVEQAKLVASDGEAGDRFGFAALSGDTALVSAFRDDHQGGVDAGSAYVYTFDGATWGGEQKLVAPDAGAGDFFGIITALRGDVALVGASGDDDAGQDAGAAYVYRRDGATWTFEQKLVPAGLDAGDALGFPVSLSPCGTVALLGAGYDDDNGPFAGAAYVYRYDGATWVEEQKLVAPDGETNDLYGFATAVDGDVLAVGSFLDDDRGQNAGAVYVYRYDGAAWALEVKLAPAGLEAGDEFGVDVNLDGDVLAVTATGDDDRGQGAGAVHVFRRHAGAWTPQATLTASDAGADDFFGIVWLDGDHLAVGVQWNDEGAPNAGAAYVFAGIEAADYNGNGVADVCEAQCPADTNGDGDVDFEDLLRLLTDWGGCE